MEIPRQHCFKNITKLPATDLLFITLVYDCMLHMTSSDSEKGENSKIQYAELVFMEYIWQEQVIHLLGMLVKGSRVEECVKITIVRFETWFYGENESFNVEFTTFW